MTIGKDVSTLFTDVINCIQTGNYFICCIVLAKKNMLLIVERVHVFFRQPGAEEACVLVPDQLRKESA